MFTPLRRKTPLTSLLFLVAMAAPPHAPAETSDFNPAYESGQQAKPVVPEGPQVRIDLTAGPLEERVERLLSEMTTQEKVGQLCQSAVFATDLPSEAADRVRAGLVGSLFYTGSISQTREAKRLAREESRLGIPLLTPRDVIHGFRTVFPIPLGQAASWNPELIQEAASIAATEAQSAGVNWTFAPMLDISRDPRWGRIAESPGEDPVLAAAIAAAMIEGFQRPGGDEDPRAGIAACGKHFAAYGLSEGGRDYNRAQVAVSELHNVFLRPFRVAVDRGAATFMTSFNTINGVPGTAHRRLVRGVLKEDWGFDGLVVSDWGSVLELIEHGFAADEADAARAALLAGVDMEMATPCFADNLVRLVESGGVPSESIDDAVRRILRVKLRYAVEEPEPLEEVHPPTDASREVARRLARQSVVLLKNEAQALPLHAASLKKIVVLGPLADAARDQLGCWMLDGKPEEAITVADALRDGLPNHVQVQTLPVLDSCLDTSSDRFPEAIEAVSQADVAIVCVGEGWQLSGEARSRASIDLPGAQRELVREVTRTGTPCVMVVLAGRPLTIGDELDAVDAALYAWHPGTMGGPALADLLLGLESPSGKLPVTFPKHTGQAPLYYNAPRTGRPPLPETQALLGSGREDFPEPQKYRSHYLDVDPFPLRPFGFGLSYTTLEYGSVELSVEAVEPGQTVAVRAPLRNTGSVATEEVAQLYVQDTTASLVRPVRELKAFRRVRLEPGESVNLEFALPTDELAYYDNEGAVVLEPGRFRVAVGGDSTAPFTAEFVLSPQESRDREARPRVASQR